MPSSVSDALSLTFAALADPTRRAILSRLASGEAVVKDLAEPFAMSSPAVSKHLRVLERAGLIERGRLAQWRPRRLVARPLAEADAWLKAYRPFWEARFDRIDGALRRLKADKAATTAKGAPPGTAASPRTTAAKRRKAP